jgi:hypothetical protein
MAPHAVIAGGAGSTMSLDQVRMQGMQRSSVGCAGSHRYGQAYQSGGCESGHARMTVAQHQQCHASRHITARFYAGCRHRQSKPSADLLLWIACRCWPWFTGLRWW